MFIFNIYDAQGNGFDYYDSGSVRDAGYYTISINGMVIKRGSEFGFIETTTLTLPAMISTSKVPSLLPSTSNVPSQLPTMMLSTKPSISNAPSLLPPSIFSATIPPITYDSMIKIRITTDQIP